MFQKDLYIVCNTNMFCMKIYFSNEIHIFYIFIYIFLCKKSKIIRYCFDNNSTQFLFDYLTYRKQRTKIGQVYSPWDEITSGVPQGSILAPLIFNIDLSDMFFILKNYEIASHADDTTPYVTCDTIESMIASLEQIAKEIF